MVVAIFGTTTVEARLYGRNSRASGPQLRPLCSNNVGLLGGCRLRRPGRGGRVGNFKRHLGMCAHRAGIRPHFVNPDAVAQRRNPFINRDRKTSIRACRYRGDEAVVEIKPQRDARTRLAAHVELAARLCLDRLHNRPSALTLPAAIPRRWVCSASSGPRPAARSRSAKAPPLRSVWTWPVCRRAVAHATSGRKCLREAGAAP
jgi:hypothetical protein